MSVMPDKLGFADAQQRLRDKLGLDITFFGPLQAVYPPGTSIDPETDLPYDPMLIPTSSGQASAIVRCSVVHRPLTLPASHGEESAEGWGSHDDVSLIMAADQAPTVASATSFMYAEHLFTIRTTMFDGIGDIQRYLIHGARQS
jgi:hypothetical protein